MTLTVTIASTGATVLIAGMKITETVNKRNTCSFTVLDNVVGLFQQMQQVSVVDSVLGTKFVGFIDSVVMDRMTPLASRYHIINCKDNNWLAEKHIYTGPEMSGQTTGDVFCKMHRDYLSAEGVSAAYVMDRDVLQSDFAAGTLVGTTAVSSPDGLQLATAGTTFSKTETSTADFATGSLALTQAANNSLQLQSYQALRLTGSCSAALGSNLYTYVIFWEGSRAVSAVTTATADYLQYTIWISSTSPACTGAVDIVCTDGYTLRDSPALDQHQISPHPKTSLQNYASDQWYVRKIAMPTQMNGKTIAYATMVQEGDAEGIYTSYMYNCQYFDSTGTLLQNMYTGGLPSSNRQLANSGYYNVSMVPVTAYETTGWRTSPAYSIAAPSLLRDSIISWGQVTPQQPSSNATTTAVPVSVAVSWDGAATWLPVANHSALPGMIPGMALAGRTLQIKQTLAVAGPSPEITPQLSDCTVTIRSAYAAVKSDALQATAAGGFGTGTLSNVSTSTPGIGLTAQIRNWDDSNITSQTLYGSNTGSPPAQSETQGTLGLRCEAASDTRSRMDWAGTWTNFICEFDFQMPNNLSANYGLEYRTTSWGNGMNSGAYRMDISFTSVALNRGVNNGSGTAQANTVVSTSGTPWSPTVGNWYHCKVVVNGTSHILYIDNVLYISVTDGTYAGAGYVALRYFNNGSVRTTCLFDNFGISSSAFTGSRTHPSFSISAVGVVQDSYIGWNATVPSNTSLLIEASTNGGTTWFTCTNGGQIPGCLPGNNVSGKSLLLRETFTTSNANATPILNGITALVVGNYSASGTRVSPVLALNSVGRMGNSSVSWQALLPAGTALVVATSPDNATWTTIAASGNPIAGYGVKGPIYSDGFDTNTIANYTSGIYTGGVATTWTVDTANSRLSAVAGTNGILFWNTPGTGADVWVDAIVSQSESGGLLARYQAGGDHYRVDVRDASSGSNPNTMTIFRRVGSTTTQLDQKVIAFPRGSFHSVRVVVTGTIITTFFDGVQLSNYTDASPIVPAGKTGFFNSGGTAYWQMVQFQVQGDTLIGKNAYTKVTLTSTDPTATPLLFQLIMTARDPSLTSGAALAVTSYSYQMTVAGTLDDSAKRTNGWWDIDYGRKLWFQDRLAQLAPWPLSSVLRPDGTGDMRHSPKPLLSQKSPLYRNRQYIRNCISLVNVVENRAGDGVRQSWPLTYAVAAPPTIMWNGNQRAAVGIRGVDTGMDFYYLLGDNNITQDTSETPVSPTQTFSITYAGIKLVNVMSQNTAQQAILAALETGTGIVEAVEDGSGLSDVAGQELADARITQYAVLSRTWSFSTDRAGLKAGQMLYVFVPEFNMSGVTLFDKPFFITQIDTTLYQLADTSIAAIYDVQCTEGPAIGNWSNYFVNPV